MNFSQRAGSSGSAGVLEAWRRRWQIAAGLAALGLLAAALYVLVVPKVYTATALVKPSTAPPSTGIILLPVLVPELRGQTQAARSIGVAMMAGRILHSSLSARALSKQVTVTVPPHSWLLDITCATSSARGAAACANAFARAYLHNHGVLVAASLNAQIKVLQGAVDALRKTISALHTQVSGLRSNSPTRIADQTRAASDSVQFSTLNNQVSTLANNASPDLSGGQIIAAASPPGKPASADTTLVLSSGLAAGLLLGVIVEFWRDRRDKRICSVVVR